MIESLGFVARFFAYAGIITVVGAVALRQLVLKRVGIGLAVSARASRRSAAIGRVACVVLLVALLLKLFLQTSEMRFPTDSWITVGQQMLFGTTWGTVWLLQFVCTILLLMSFTLASKDALSRWSTIVVLVGVIAGSSAYSSHAMSAKHFASYAPTADVIHILAASTWIGTLFMMTLSVLRGDSNDTLSELTQSEQRANYIALLLRAFSPTAQVSVFLVVVSGVVSSLSHVASIGEFFGTPYGQALFRKLIFVALVMLAGFWNWRRATPALATDGPKRITRGMLVELALSVVVVALTADLVVTPPPGE